MTNLNENKKSKPNTKVVYSADIIAEYEEKKKDPKYAHCLDELERDFNFAMLNYKISQIKSDDSCSKEKVLDLKIESGLYSAAEVKKFKHVKKKLKSDLPAVGRLGRIFVIIPVVFILLVFGVFASIAGFAIHKFNTTSKSIPVSITNFASPSSSHNSNELKFIENLTGNNKFDYAFKKMNEELKLSYVYDKLATDSSFANLSQDEKDKYIENYFKNLTSDQKNDFVKYFIAH